MSATVSAVALAAGTVLLPAAAAARTIRFPEANPAVTFEVPDDWAVTPADGGLQLVSPDRTSIILAGIAKADKAGLTDWQRAAARRMVDFGVSFDAKANAQATPHPTAADSSLAPLADPAAQPKVKAGELAPLSSVPSMALLGKASDLSVAALEADEPAPKPEVPEAGKVEADKADASKVDAGKVEAGKADTAKPDPSKADAPKSDVPKTDVPKAEAGKLEASKPAEDKRSAEKARADKALADKALADKVLADKAARAAKPLHFASVVIRGASLKGKPVDVQFLNFGYSKERWFLMQQESGADDDRAGAIIKSVRAIR